MKWEHWIWEVWSLKPLLSHPLNLFLVEVLGLVDVEPVTVLLDLLDSFGKVPGDEVFPQTVVPGDHTGLLAAAAEIEDGGDWEEVEDVEEELWGEAS